MRTNILAIIILTLIVLGHCQMVGFARQSQSKCAQIKYVAPPIHSKTYRLSRIEGQIVYASPSQKWDSGSANGLCVTLFNRVSGELVAEGTTDDRGQFGLANAVKKKFKAGIIRGPNYALFLDRVLVEDGKSQVYGLRAKPFAQWKNGEPVLYPIADEANVDKRRAEVGLSSLAEYRQWLKRMYYPERK